MAGLIGRFFRFAELGTTLRTEVLAGITTFMTMAYIIFVNPSLLSQTGMDFGAVMAATCIATAVGTIFMGLFVNYPIAVAPGMGLNAFFTFTVVLGMGIPWRVALGCVFIEGIIFLILTLVRVRQMIIDSIPAALRHATACGIGLFIAFIGLKDAGLVVASPATLVTLGNVLSAPTVLALAGLVITAALMVRRVHGALLWGTLITALLGLPLGVVKYQGLVSLPPSMAPTFMQMDIRGAFEMGLLSVVFIFLFTEIFDTVGTLAGIGEVGGFMRNGKLPKAGKAMFADAVGTCVGAVCGTSTVTAYIESAAGISAGARTGFASVVTGLLFFAALFFSPVARMIGGGYDAGKGLLLHPVTAPVLIIVGCLMLVMVTQIDWKDYSEALPSFLVIIMMPLTFSIATGIAIGFISYSLIKLLTGHGREVSWLVYALAAIFIVRFIYLSSI